MFVFTFFLERGFLFILYFGLKYIYCIYFGSNKELSLFNKIFLLPPQRLLFHYVFLHLKSLAWQRQRSENNVEHSVPRRKMKIRLHFIVSAPHEQKIKKKKPDPKSMFQTIILSSLMWRILKLGANFSSSSNNLLINLNYSLP